MAGAPQLGSQIGFEPTKGGKNLTAGERVMKAHWFSISIATILVLALGACSQLEKKPPAVSHDGLHLVEDTKLAVVYRNPKADFSQYRMAMVENCNVAFRKNWQRDQNSDRMDLTNMVTNKDVTQIQNSLSKSCNEHFRESVEKDSNLQLVEEITPGNPTLVLRPSIVNLDINAPDLMTAGISRTYTTSAGEMTLFLEVYDAATNAILARVVDRREDYDDSMLRWTNSVTNKMDADRAFDYWTKLLSESLDSAMNTSSGESQP